MNHVGLVVRLVLRLVQQSVPYICRQFPVRLSILIVHFFCDVAHFLAQVDVASEVQHDLLMHISDLAQRGDESFMPLLNQRLVSVCHPEVHDDLVLHDPFCGEPVASSS